TADRLVSGASIFAGGIDQVDQRAAALDMAEEPVADARTLVRALDQAGDVGEHELLTLVADDAEIGGQGCERIGGDLRLGRGDTREERRLTCVREADNADVGDELKPKPYPLLLAFQARVRAAGRAVSRGLEVGVAEATIAALGKKLPLTQLRQIG